jgi:hypothetical protein
MLRQSLQTEVALFVGIWLFFMLGGRSQMFRDPGTFWHTATGHWILSTGRIIDTDPFSFTFGGRPWVAYEWLGECLMGLLDKLGGLDTLLLATATLLAGLYGWVAHRLLKSGLHWLPVVFLIMLTIAASANHLHVRPHLSTIVFLGLTFAWLCDFEAERIGLERLCWLIPVFWAWSNMHGGVLAGLATMVLAVAGWVVFRLLGRDSSIHSSRQLVGLVLLITACCVTFLVNPYGWRLPKVWLEILSSPVVARLIQEHAPLNPREPGGWLVILLGLVYIGTLASIRPWRPRVTWLIPLFWLWQTTMRVRHSPLFGITAALALAEMLPYTRLAAFLARPGRDLFRYGAIAGWQHLAVIEGGSVEGRQLERASAWWLACWKPALISAGVVLMSLALQAAGIRAPVVGRGWVKLDPKHWPVELLPELRQLDREHPAGTRIFNDFLYGGFLIYFTPGLKVFIDDRCEVYGDQFLTQYAEAAQRRPEQVEIWRKQFEFPYALVTAGSSFDDYLARSQRWFPVKQTGVASLYQFRAEGGTPEDLRQHEHEGSH